MGLDAVHVVALVAAARAQVTAFGEQRLGPFAQGVGAQTLLEHAYNERRLQGFAGLLVEGL